MPCRPITLPGGVTGLVCSRGRARTKPCVECGEPGDLLCDFPLKGRKAGSTCSRPICTRCSSSKPDGKGDSHDLCRAHAQQQTLDLPAAR